MRLRCAGSQDVSHQHLIFYYPAAYKAGETRHAQIVMREFAEQNGIVILGAEPHTISDAWVFCVKSGRDALPPLPDFIYVYERGEHEPSS